jgi:SAM-dependent methyltransferase
MTAAPLHINHAFMLDFAQQSGGAILDFGCGAGEVVRAGLAANLDIHGCEVFYGGSHGHIEGCRDLIQAGRVREMNDGLIPFSDASFDCIVNNQVFEHVADLPAALAEIHRVLKPGGNLLSIFPSIEVLREGHCGVPLAHRFAARRFGYYWLLAFRLLGFGYFTKGKSRRRWAEEFQLWLNTYCFYRPSRDILDAFSTGFKTIPLEREYISFRGLPLFAPAMLRRLGFMVLLSTRV